MALGHGVQGQRGAALLGDADLRPGGPLLGRGAQLHQPGSVEHFREFIGSISAEQRELFRFPPAGHSYYDAETLAALEEQYPGWNAGKEYI